MDNKLHNAGLSHLSRWISIGAVVSLASLAFILAPQPWVDSATLNDPRAAPRTVSPRGELWPEEKSTIGLFRQASPAVVNITAIGVQRDLFTLNLTRYRKEPAPDLFGIPKATSSPIFM
jgi:hypothetical protein